MTYLACSEYDCCHNKGGACCRMDIAVHREGGRDSVCRTYRNSEGVGNVAADNAPATAETDIRCDDAGCCFNRAGGCCADRVRIDECPCGPRCVTRTEK